MPFCVSHEIHPLIQPLAANLAERVTTGETRCSLHERYPKAQDYVTQVWESAEKRVADRLSLKVDTKRIVDQAITNVHLDLHRATAKDHSAAQG